MNRRMGFYYAPDEISPGISARPCRNASRVRGQWPVRVLNAEPRDQESVTAASVGGKPERRQMRSVGPEHRRRRIPGMIV